VPAAPLKLARCPHSLAASLRSFTFYVTDPTAPFSFSQATRLPLQLLAADKAASRAVHTDAS
jgi:hypothetical protein